MAKPTSPTGNRAARVRAIKKEIAASIARARADAFNQAFEVAAREHPSGQSCAFVRWFEEAWAMAIEPKAGKRVSGVGHG
jgi:hypothetical protein